MKIAILFGLLGVAFAAPNLQWVPRVADDCNLDNCKLPDCRCSSSDIPGGFSAKEVPQLVYFTFDDAVTAQNHDDFYVKAFGGRKNPDGCPVQATFYISHEYTDYSKVNDLYQAGHEIALHSITHQSSTDYWKKISKDELVKEFGGERQLMTKFAGIPEEHIYGMRLPLLQMSGDNSFIAAKEVGLSYDCSWPTRTFTEPGLWPYTMDYSSVQDCGVPPCPESSIPGFWVQPMLDLFDDEDGHCAMVDACPNVPDEVDLIFDFLKKNFDRSYNGNRAPVGFYMHAAWFGKLENAFEAYVKFIDYLQTLEDVYLVGVERGIQWVRNPVKLGEPLWSGCQEVKETECVTSVCRLMKGEEERYMTLCGSCPKQYPWLGNPLGVS